MRGSEQFAYLRTIIVPRADFGQKSQETQLREII